MTLAQFYFILSIYIIKNGSHNLQQSKFWGLAVLLLLNDGSWHWEDVSPLGTEEYLDRPAVVHIAGSGSARDLQMWQVSSFLSSWQVI